MEEISMTESERLINEGFLPKEFWNSEIINDYKVNENQKKIWAIEIDMLTQLDAVCRKNNLRYYLMYGTLLGAYRHGGFIPWDDDIDVVMPRKDYERLKQLKNVFANPYYLQFPGEDEGYYFSFAKLRNSRTTGITMPFRYQSYNHGLWIDIFPLDNIELEDAANIRRSAERLVEINSVNMRRSNPFPTDSEIEKINNTEYIEPQTALKELDEIVRRYENVETQYVAISSLMLYPMEKQIYAAEDFSVPKELELWGRKYFVPQNAYNILEKLYGEWREFPPVEKRGCWHNNVIMNADEPYYSQLESIRQKDIKRM